MFCLIWLVWFDYEVVVVVCVSVCCAGCFLNVLYWCLRLFCCVNSVGFLWVFY